MTFTGKTTSTIWSDPMHNAHDKAGWGTIFSVLVGLLVAIVPLVWQAQRLGESQKAVENTNRNSEAIQKWRQLQFEQREQQRGRRHDQEIQYPQRQRDPRLVPGHEQALQQLVPGRSNDPTNPHR